MSCGVQLGEEGAGGVEGVVECFGEESRVGGCVEAVAMSGQAGSRWNALR